MNAEAVVTLWTQAMTVAVLDFRHEPPTCFRPTSNRPELQQPTREPLSPLPKRGLHNRASGEGSTFYEHWLQGDFRNRSLHQAVMDELAYRRLEMNRILLTAFGSAALLGFSAPGTAHPIPPSGDQHQDDHDQLDEQHGDVHDQLNAIHNDAHEQGLSRREHRRLHRQLDRAHANADGDIADQHDVQHQYQQNGYNNGYGSNGYQDGYSNNGYNNGYSSNGYNRNYGYRTRGYYHRRHHSYYRAY